MEHGNRADRTLSLELNFGTNQRKKDTRATKAILPRNPFHTDDRSIP